VNEVQLLVDGLAERLGRPVGVDDRRFRAVAYSSHRHEIDPVRRDSILGRRAPLEVTAWLEEIGVLNAERFLRVPANPNLEMVARVCFPLRFRGRLLGFLWLLEGEEPFSPEDLDTCQRFADETADELYRLRQREQAEREHEASLITSVLSPSDDGRRAPAIGPAAHYGVLALGVRLGDLSPARIELRLTDAVDRSRRSVPPRHQLASVSGSGAIVLLAVASEEEVGTNAQVLLTAAQHELDDVPSAEPIVGVGAPVSAYSDLARSHDQAQLALHLARTMPGLAPLVRWEELGALGLLAQLVGDRDPAALLTAPIRKLLAAPDGDALVTTLEAYLEHAGDAAETAAQVFLHRSSLYKRLHRIERLADVDLGSGADRLELHIGITLWRMSGGATG
jgi:DNA-binding PucR family transcriptional regulator